MRWNELQVALMITKMISMQEIEMNLGGIDNYFKKSTSFRANFVAASGQFAVINFQS